MKKSRHEGLRFHASASRWRLPLSVFSAAASHTLETIVFVRVRTELLRISDGNIDFTDIGVLPLRSQSHGVCRCLFEPLTVCFQAKAELEFSLSGRPRQSCRPAEAITLEEMPPRTLCH